MSLMLFQSHWFAFTGGLHSRTFVTIDT